MHGLGCRVYVAVMSLLELNTLNPKVKLCSGPMAVHLREPNVSTLRVFLWGAAAAPRKFDAVEASL